MGISQIIGALCYQGIGLFLGHCQDFALGIEVGLGIDDGSLGARQHFGAGTVAEQRQTGLGFGQNRPGCGNVIGRHTADSLVEYRLRPGQLGRGDSHISLGLGHSGSGRLGIE